MAQDVASWPSGEGEMAERIRLHEWAATRIGPIATWPQSLKTAVDLILGSGHAMMLAWGPERTILYNDVYAPIMGDHHPAGLGRPLADAWPDVWNEIAPLVARALAGEMIKAELMPLMSTRHGVVEQTWWTFSYSPVRDEAGAVAGLLNVSIDTTLKVLAERGRDEAYRQLAQSEALYRVLFDSIEDGFCVIEVLFDKLGKAFDLRFLKANPAFERQTGLHEAVGKTMLSMVPEHEPFWIEIYDRIVRTRRPERFDHRADALGRWYEVDATPFGEVGKNQVAVVFRDVLHRRKAEEAIRESEERQRLTIELVPALLWSASPDGQEVTLNEGWLGYTGQSEAETQHHGWFNAIHPDDLAATRAAFAHAYATGESLERVQRIHKAGNGWRWHLVRQVPVRQENGPITRWFGAAVDVHESKLAERALQEAEKRLQTLVEGVPQLVWRAVGEGQWTWASPQWTAITGQAENGSHGSGWLQSVHPEERAGVRIIWAEAIKRGEFHADYRICHASDERYRWYQSCATPVRDDAGTIIEWLGTSTDVDDIRQLQARQEVLVKELQHRTRNLLGVVRSMADRTGQASRDLGDFRLRFRDRLEALARVQGLLSRLGQTDRILFDEVIRNELKAMDGAAEKVMLNGPGGIRLRSSTVQTLAMALHELATNAAKYGALSQPQAMLAISWRMTPPDKRGRPWLHIDWRESGVRMPSTCAPQGTGQGRELIEKALPYQLGAQTSFHLGPDGVHCTLSIPTSASNAEQDTIHARNLGRELDPSLKKSISSSPFEF